MQEISQEQADARSAELLDMSLQEYEEFMEDYGRYLESREYLESDIKLCKEFIANFQTLSKERELTKREKEELDILMYGLEESQKKLDAILENEEESNQETKRRNRK